MKFDSFEHLLRHYAEVSPERTAFLYGDGVRMSYSGLLDAVRARAAELKSSGIGCVGIFCTSDKDRIISIFAAAMCGMQTVLLDPDSDTEVLQEQINATDVQALIGSDEETEGLTCRKDAEPSEPDSMLFFTSGTTAGSRAVVLSQRTLCASAFNGGEMLGLDSGDVLLCCLPLSHVFGFVCSLLWGLSCGCAVALGRGSRYLTEDFLFFRPTAVSLVPMLLGFFMKYRLFNAELKLILIGAGECDPALVEGARAMGKRVAFGYGLTETSSGVAISTGGDPFAMDICPEDRITIAGDGEILIEAPTCVMKGYYRDDEGTNSVLRGGVLYTGDLGSFDENGRLHIIGRKKEMLVLPSGTKIFLPEYEKPLAGALGTAEIAVTLKGSRPALIIGKTSMTKEEAKKLIAPVMAALSRDRQISDVIVTGKELPRTKTGKLRRWQLDEFLK